MDEARALRDTLEKAQAELRRIRAHLEKLRAHQAREREGLQREVEAARREVAELRARLEAPPVPARLKAAPVQAPHTPLRRSVEVERSAEAVSALVALVRRPESLETAVPVLSRRLGVPAADLRLRLAAPTPAVLARVPVSEVEALRMALLAEGFVAVIREVRPRSAEEPLLARHFSLDAAGLQVEGPRGVRQHLPYAGLRLLVRGRRTTTTVEQSVEWVTPCV